MRLQLEASGRWSLDGQELHCGDCFQVRISANHPWLDVRIEFGLGAYYLVGIPPQYAKWSPSDFQARRYQ
jgi:hypothetical protein